MNASRIIRPTVLSALVALAQLSVTPQAAALTPPQDSTYPSGVFPTLPNEFQTAPLIANGKVFYAARPGGGPIIGLRARNFDGELVFEHLDAQAQLEVFNQSIPRYGVSSDGRIYYLKGISQSNARVVILNPDGSKFGEFGPEGAEGSFNSNVQQGPIIAVSPESGRVYISDDLSSGGTVDQDRKGLIRVFDRDGVALHTFRINGILAPTLEGRIGSLAVRVDEDGNDEVIVIDVGVSGGFSVGHLKFFGGDGGFIKIIPPNSLLSSAGIRLSNGLLIFNHHGWGLGLQAFSPSFTGWSESLVSIPGFLGGQIPIGFTQSGDLLVNAGQNDNKLIYVVFYPNYATFDAASRNSVPNPWVLNIGQRPGSGIVDVDYRVDDADDETVTTALLGFAGGTASLNNVIPLTTVIEGTEAKVGANIATGQVHRVTWDAGADWNVDFGTLRVMALARDSRDKWFDVHLVEIPADGNRPAVTIHRTTMTQPDFLAQFLWLVATKDPSVNLVDGVLFGTSGAYNGEILANGVNSTPAGRAFLLARDDLRIATAAEVTRALEGATPNYVVRLNPPLQMTRRNPENTGNVVSPQLINEFGIESSPPPSQIGDAHGRWFVVRNSAE